MSACVKYLIPQMAADSIESLGVVLGAQSYIASGHRHGIFEKMRRDCAVTALFEGSSPVVLKAIADQLPSLVRAREVKVVEEIPSDLFAMSSPPLTWPDGNDFELTTDSDAILNGVAQAYGVICGEGKHTAAHHRELLELLEWCLTETERLDTELVRHAGESGRHLSGAGYDLAARYTHLHAAGALP
jgi:hypothetical protein